MEQLSEERPAIRDLYVRYALEIDERHYERWIECFTKDGTFDSPRFGRHAGHDGLRKFTAIYHESLGGAKVRHVITNILVDIEGDRASGTCYLIYYHTKHGKTDLAGVGGYRDKLRKVDGHWLFESRQVFIDGG